MTVDLYHRITGSGPHVLLLHAVGMNSTFLEPLAAILARDFTVLTVDMRGHGKSPYAPSTGLADYADDIHALLTKLKFAPCGVAGFAMGGLVTQALAVKYPEDVRAAVIANVNHAQTKESFAALMQRAEDARRDGMASILDETMARWFNEPFRRTGGDAPVREQLLAKDIRGWCDAFTAMANVDTAPKLKSLRMPVLCLAGGDDRSTPPPVVKAMADAIPGSRYAELPDGPHMMFFELPEETARIVGPFFREVLN